ncbi:MAG: hypothetical protein B9J98_02905 [Candidatus Terraquivivens tikiterensis]|uniref:Uncharacterized protein n=1 Tax=Candidatus Terraquivivens tikiterensis TaxID=1980982 RepID=A0A2R7Y676_9ARCH|nr:MAG: hypothetical protein B9J98_02905 [Candidatus Terraquivivens tikiterensis]
MDVTILDEIRRWEDDVIFKLLSERCTLTKKQLVTLLMDLIPESRGMRLSVEEKAKLRGVSKGSFLRTKKQAMDNVVRALYTVLLLGYLGLLELPNYSWFLQASETLNNRDPEAIANLLLKLTEARR